MADLCGLTQNDQPRGKHEVAGDQHRATTESVDQPSRDWPRGRRHQQRGRERCKHCGVGHADLTTYRLSQDGWQVVRRRPR